jgi:hypothetical protein
MISEQKFQNKEVQSTYEPRIMNKEHQYGEILGKLCTSISIGTIKNE